MVPQDSTETIRYELDADGIVLLTIDDPDRPVNTMSARFKAELADMVDRLRAERETLRGVVLASSKETFFAGGDLRRLRGIRADQRDELVAGALKTKASLRGIETLGVPVVAAINGAALGGGLELCLACHHRVAVDRRSVQLGFPEVTLGLLPGAGGIVRSVRAVGVIEALRSMLLRGTRHTAREALELGLVDQLVDDADALVEAAKAWIHHRVPHPAQQPWDRDGYAVPGGAPTIEAVREHLPPAVLRQLETGKYPAIAAIIEVAIQSANTDFESASRIETEFFADLVIGQVAKNMMQVYFFDMQRVNGDRGRAADERPWRPEKVAVLGAGMMGASIAYVCASNDTDVVLKDVSLDAARRGKRVSERLVAAAVDRGRMTREGGQALLARITPADDAAVAQGADLVIEAVFEDPVLKGQVLAEIEPYVRPDATLASNTTSLPITQLGASVQRPADFIGMHFFSPVERMPLVEIIRGRETSDITVRRALDVAGMLRKTPIVVNDSRGFFTSRVIRTFLNEAGAMLLEGIPAACIERASALAGYPVSPLQLRDELNMGLAAAVRDHEREDALAEGRPWMPPAGIEAIDRMLAADRPGRVAGAGFYDYEDGRRLGLWSGLDDLFGPVVDPTTVDLVMLQERMLFAESLEAIRCLDEGVITSVAEANVGSILGIGYPGWTGGVLQYVNGYEGAPGTGPSAFLTRARDLAAAYGSRFAPPASLVEIGELPRHGASRHY